VAGRGSESASGDETPSAENPRRNDARCLHVAYMY